MIFVVEGEGRGQEACVHVLIGDAHSSNGFGGLVVEVTRAATGEMSTHEVSAGGGRVTPVVE